MFGWIGKIVRRYRERQRFERQLDPKAIGTLARELEQLCGVADTVCPPEAGEQRGKIRAIRAEMRRLADLISRPEFRRLPASRRLLLRQGMLKSRKQILDCIVQAPPPTTIRQ